MTAKPSNMSPRGIAIAKIAAVTRDQQKREQREQAMFEKSKDQVTELFWHFVTEIAPPGSDPIAGVEQAAATLALATVMNLEEDIE